MSKAKKEKKKLVKAVAPQHVDATDPLVISFAAWDPASLPAEVTVEVVETDTMSANDDNFTTSDDVIVRYTGTMVAAADGTAELNNIKIVDVSSPARSPDRVWVRFAQQTNSDVVEAGIPFSAALKEDTKTKTKAKEAEYSANEGSFYEVAVRVLAGHGADGEELVMSAATAVRQRADVLLAVEPLSQNDSSMTHETGIRILETFHPDEIKLHQPRRWGSVVLRIRERYPMVLGSSGCSYVILAMLLRYLRIDSKNQGASDDGVEKLDPRDNSAGKTIRLFDHHIKLSELEAHPDHKPRFHKGSALEQATAEAVKLLDKERDSFVDHFVQAAGELSKAEKKKLVSKLKSIFNEKTDGKGEIIPIEPHSADNVDDTEAYQPVSHPIAEQSYLPMLVWRLHILDDRADSYTLRRYEVNYNQLDNAADYQALGAGEYEEWQPKFVERPLMDNGKPMGIFDHMHEGMGHGKSSTNDQGILIPLSGPVQKLFGLVDTTPFNDIVSYGETEPGDKSLLPWQRFLVRMLDRGLPVVGLFSPGQYSERDSGGHFCLIVGYRFRADPNDPTIKKIRFILNDPAGGQTHQYEAHDEEELNPEGKDPTAPLKEGNKKLGAERERRGLNLVIERRVRLSLREVRVYEPGVDKESTWNPARHARFMFFRGKVQSDVGG